VETRGVSTPVISVNGIGEESQQAGAPAAAGVTFSSTKVFHSWHAGQRPIHFGELYPHCWQVYWVLVFIK
jgi:hypothetical protein